MELIDESKPIARKEHICNLCSRKISKGQRYRRQFIRGDGGEIWSFKSHEECCELTSIIDSSDYYEGFDCDVFEEAITNYVQEYHQGTEDAINVALQNRNYYGLAKMILAELKEKGIKHIKLID
jgi:hypothetical protein|nr:MAG TPA: hypothetical protein [Caudoviricetes sp.]